MCTQLKKLLAYAYEQLVEEQFAVIFQPYQEYAAFQIVRLGLQLFSNAFELRYWTLRARWQQAKQTELF